MVGHGILSRVGYGCYDTPERRRWIDAELDEAAEGPYYGPFETADAAIKFVNEEIRKRRTRKAPTAKK